MDDSHFDELIKLLVKGTSRRLIQGLASGVLGLVTLGEAAACDLTRSAAGETWTAMACA